MSPKTTKTDPQYFAKIYRPLFIVNLICGINMRLFKSTIAKIAYSIYNLLIVTAISYSMVTCWPDQELSTVWSLVEYLIFVVFMTCYKTKIYGYLEGITELDSYLRINRRFYYRMRRRMLIFIVFIWSIGVVYSVCYCIFFSCFTSIFKFVVFQFCYLALDINRVWRYSVFEAVWRRLRVLRMRMEECPDENYYLYVKDNKTLKDDKIKLSLCLYRKIADLLDLMSPELNASLLAGLMCSLPKVIVNIYKILLVVDRSMPLPTLGFMVLHVCQSALFMFSPCVVIEMFGAEVERIQQFLVHRLMVAKDRAMIEDIQLFMQYTNIRSFKYRIWRAVPMGAAFPIEVLNLCTTYVIVIVNFTNIFND